MQPYCQQGCRDEDKALGRNSDHRCSDKPPVTLLSDDFPSCLFSVCSLSSVVKSSKVEIPGIHRTSSGYNLNNSRNRLVCARLTGISVCFLSLIFSM
jgi:hypothetical protein